jgi:hypothetical protein
MCRTSQARTCSAPATGSALATCRKGDANGSASLAAAAPCLTAYSTASAAPLAARCCSIDSAGGGSGGAACLWCEGSDNRAR